MALTNLDDGTIQFYLSAKVVSDKVKAALAEVVKRKHAFEQVPSSAAARAADPEIGEDQARIRQNMAQLDRNSDVYKNYVKKFSDQERGDREAPRPGCRAFRPTKRTSERRIDELPSWGWIWPAVTTGHQSQRSRASMQSLRCTRPLC